MEQESDHSYLPGKKLKKKKKKKKAPKKDNNADIERELMMAKAYGGITQQQYEKLVQMKKMKDQHNSQLSLMLGGKPPLGGTSRLAGGVASRKQKMRGLDLGTNSALLNDVDVMSDAGMSQTGAQAYLPRHVQKVKRVGGGFVPKTNDGSSSNRNDRESLQRTGFNIVRNNPRNNQSLHSTMDANRGENRSEQSDRFRHQNNPSERDRKLSNIANSVSGFYAGADPGEQSVHNSVMKSTNSQMAQNFMTQRAKK